MNKTFLPVFLIGALAVSPCVAQVPDASRQAEPAAPANNGGQAPAKSDGGGSSGGSSFLGKDVPFFDPSSETVTWDGKSWNINSNRVFQARFEKYLNAPEEDSEQYKQYSAILRSITDKLAPGRATPRSLDEAFKLLPQAAEFNADANLCDSIANQVYAAWTANQANDRLVSANKVLEDDRKRLEWNTKMAAGASSLSSAPSDPALAAEWTRRQQERRDAEMQPLATRLAEVNALLKANQLKREVGSLQARIEFQALIVQMFLQRRFQHVLIATRFYRNIFNDGDSQLRVGEDAKSLFAKTTGMPPTVSTLDAMANEAIRDVREGVDAFDFLLEKDELESASKRLAESFLLGEYMPEIRGLPREKKRQALDFVQNANQLISAIEVKDYALAESLVTQLEKTAKDFDNSKPMAAIQTAKTLAAMHLAKAKNAAVSGDRATLETELKEATQIWPRNPALAEVSGMIFNQADVQQRALLDFDQMLSQKNYRGIFDDQARFIAATATDARRQTQLKEVLQNMQLVEGAILRAQEIEKRGDSAGAWESAEKAFGQFPDDNKLNQVRADLTTKAADFVRALRTAEELEKKDQYGSSLAWYLKARAKYPGSEIASEGITRVVKEILPDGT